MIRKRVRLLVITYVRQATLYLIQLRALRLKADAMERRLRAQPPGNVVGAAEVIAKVFHFHGNSRAATQLMQCLQAIDYGDYNVRQPPMLKWIEK